MKYKGTGAIATTDYKAVKWVGKTKGGNAVTIKLDDAINMGNIDLAFAEKDDTVAELTFTATYSNTNEVANSTEEPWEVEVAGSVVSGANEILLGAGVFYIGETPIALTRGGGQFTVEREFRQINADGDRGPVKGRIEIDSSVATLTINALTILTRMADLYAGLNSVE